MDLAQRRRTYYRSMSVASLELECSRAWKLDNLPFTCAPY